MFRGLVNLSKKDSFSEVRLRVEREANWGKVKQQTGPRLGKWSKNIDRRGRKKKKREKFGGKRFPRGTDRVRKEGKEAESQTQKVALKNLFGSLGKEQKGLPGATKP